MGAITKIRWTRHTWNAWWGCTKVSPACRTCYAEAIARAYGHKVWGPKAPRRMLSEDNWKVPRKWNEAARRAGVRAQVFAFSMADIFERHEDPIINKQLDDARARVFAMQEELVWLDWLDLTKRPENILEMVPRHWRIRGGWPGNVWQGITAENADEAWHRIDTAEHVPAPVLFLSMEPLLSAVRLPRSFLEPRGVSPRTRWVITGGESGAGARLTHPLWTRDVRDQCIGAGVPYFHKQNGEYGFDESALVATRRDYEALAPTLVGKARRKPVVIDLGGNILSSRADVLRAETAGRFPVAVGRKLGVKTTGYLLDGVEHSEWPQTGFLAA